MLGLLIFLPVAIGLEHCVASLADCKSEEIWCYDCYNDNDSAPSQNYCCTVYWWVWVSSFLVRLLIVRVGFKTVRQVST